MAVELSHIEQNVIENKIYTIAGEKVMLDKDLAELFQTETRTLKQAVNRCIDRFPNDFMMKLNDETVQLLVSQGVIPSKSHFGGATPYAFTEQGVAMLSAIIRTPIAVKTSIQIIRAFIVLRKLVLSNTELFQRIGIVELKQLETDKKMDIVFKALERREHIPDKGIFFEGEVFDAYSLVSSLIKKAQTSIILIDNYIDDTTLTLLSKRAKCVEAFIYTKHINKQIQLDIKKHNEQYPPIELKIFTESHDRFLIIDKKELYHCGASLKDLGKKMFAFSRMDSLKNEVLEKLK